MSGRKPIVVKVRENTSTRIDYAIKTIDALNKTLHELGSPFEIYAFRRVDQSDPLKQILDIGMHVRSEFEWK